MVPIISNQSSQTVVPKESSGAGAGAAKALASDTVVGMTLKDRYLVEKEIGTGGFGAVYLARDLELLSKPVVIKLLLEKSLHNEWVVQKFRHEIEALSRIDHPGVVGVLATGSMPSGNPFIVMEYVEGVSLRSLMEAERNGMDFERATHIIHQIGYALKAAHEKGIVHRDLKPENVMVRQLDGEEEQVKIIDFGIAKVKDSRLAPSTVIAETAGTIVYMAPEQINGQSVSASTDIYSLGAIAYEMLTARRPFNPNTLFQLSEIQRAGVKIKPSDLRRGLPLAADEVILKALAFEADARFATAAKFADAFAEAMLEGTVSESRRAQRIAKTVQLPKLVVPIPKKRKPWLLVVPAILFLTVLVAVGSIIWKRSTNSVVNEPVGVIKPPASNPARTSEVAARKIEYYLMVQKYLPNGTKYQEPFKSTGRDTLTDGWQFTLNITSPQDGFLYLVNEGPLANTITYNLLYPSPKYSQGSARVDAGQKREIGPYTLDPNQGKEKLWLVWSANEVAEFEAVKAVVNPKDRGVISDQHRVDAISKFLSSHSPKEPDEDIDKANYVVQVRSSTNALVKLIELEHR